MGTPKKEAATRKKSKQLWELIQTELQAQGIELDSSYDPETGDPHQVKVVCLKTDLSDSVQQLSRSSRDQVIMVRVDSETCHKLDQWVEAGAVRSRSEAAALFIREGLQVRNSELKQLEDALQTVAEAKRKLHEKAQLIFKTPKSAPSDKG